MIIDDCLGICAELEADMARHVATYECEWKVTIESPERMRRFRTFVNSDEPDPAWDVAHVDVSVDGGATWAGARVEPRQFVQAWQRFALDWPVKAPGTYQIACRALDVRGRRQPSEGRNQVHVVTVTVA